MASGSRRDLFLSVNGNVDNLASAMKVGRTVLHDFGVAAGDVQAEVQRRLSDLAGPGFQNALRTMDQSFTATLNQIRANARSVLDAPSGAAAVDIINVNAAREAAAAAERRAAGLRLVADAAARATAATETDNAALRTYTVAAETAAVSAENEANALRAQATALGIVESKLEQVGAVQRQNTQVVGAQKAGFQQLSFQLNDVAVQFAAGTPPMIIFAQQSGQVVQALQLIGGEAKGLLGLLAGPWGLAFTTALVVLTPFVSKLFEAETAEKLAKAGANSLADAQSALGGIFDLTSGKIKSQNELLILNARLMANNLRAEALRDQASADKTFQNSQNRSFFTDIIEQAQAAGGGTPYYQTRTARNAGQLQSVINELNARQFAVTTANTPAERKAAEQALSVARQDAIRHSRGLDFSGLSTTREQFQQAIIDAASAPEKNRIADLIDKSLDDGKLASDLRQTAKPKKPKVDHTAERAANADAAFQGDLRQANAAIARTTLQLATSSQARLDIANADIDDALERRKAEIEDKVTAKKLTQAQAKILIGKAEELAGVQRRAAQDKKADDDREAAYKLEADAASFQVDQLSIQERLANTLKERQAIQLQILDLEIAERRRALQNQKDAAKDDAEKKRIQAEIDRLPATRDARATDIRRQNESPGERLARDLDPKLIGDRIEEIKVRGLQSLEDGLVGVITGTESVAGAFKKMAASIIADLARIAIEQTIVKAIGSAIGLPGFASGGFVSIPHHATGGLIRGPGSGRSDSILSFVSNGEFIMNAGATSRFLPLLEAMNDNRLPGFADGGLVGTGSVPRLPSIPRLDSRQQVVVMVQANDYFDAKVRDLSRTEAEPIAARYSQAAVVGGAALAREQSAKASRRKLGR